VQWSSRHLSQCVLSDEAIVAIREGPLISGRSSPAALEPKTQKMLLKIVVNGSMLCCDPERP
jgi:hypothetical protein